MTTQYTFHEVANIFPMMSDDEFSALVEDIRLNGQRQPIYVHDGQIIDGRNRYRACQQLGIEPDTRVWDGAGSLVSFVVSLNLQRRHLSSSQKATVAMDVLPMLEAEAKERQRAAGERGNEGGRGNAKTLPQLIGEGFEEPREQHTNEAVQQAAQLVGTNRQYVSDAKRLRDEAPELLERVRSGELTIPQAKEVAAKTPAAIREFIGKLDEGVTPKEAFKQVSSHQLINSSKSNEYYTPLEFLDSAREVMGGVDLDPASCAEANANVRAETYYTIDEDGFSKPWAGRVWMNPPYGKDEGESETNQARWVRRACEEYAAGNITEAMVLVNAVPGNKWFHPLWEHTVCFVYRRIHFINGSGAPTHSNAVVYLGQNVQKFAEAFGKHGAVVRRIDA